MENARVWSQVVVVIRSRDSKLGLMRALTSSSLRDGYEAAADGGRLEHGRVLFRGTVGLIVLHLSIPILSFYPKGQSLPSLCDRFVEHCIQTEMANVE